ncbi:MAG: hypothetical protein LBH48_05920 [Bifidobacteriaceae bacterium]|nr:hypothetical protein [Bifidobacteriaceae bacterium]
MGAEASEVATIRRALLAAGLPQPHLHATAYWRR